MQQLIPEDKFLESHKEARWGGMCTQEAEVGRFWVQGQPGLYSEFQASLSCITRHCLKKKKSEKEVGLQ
jgi:hypothetical protein